MTVPAHPAQEKDGEPGASAAGGLRDVVLRVAGVAEVFPARALWQRLPAGALALLRGGSPDPAGDVRVEGPAADGRLEVAVRIGVAAGARTPDVARAVASAVRQHLAPAEAAVQVSVVRITPG